MALAFWMPASEETRLRCLLSLLQDSLLAESSSDFLVAKCVVWDTSLWCASFSLAYFSLLGGSLWLGKDTAQREVRGSHAVQGTRQEGNSLEQESSWRGQAGYSRERKDPKGIGVRTARAVPLQYGSLECCSLPPTPCPSFCLASVEGWNHL